MQLLSCSFEGLLFHRSFKHLLEQLCFLCSSKHCWGKLSTPVDQQHLKGQDNKHVKSHFLSFSQSKNKCHDSLQLVIHIYVHKKKQTTLDTAERHISIKWSWFTGYGILKSECEMDSCLAGHSVKDLCQKSQTLYWDKELILEHVMERVAVSFSQI